MSAAENRHPPTIRMRGPTGKSCLECRRRKVKCDLTVPCRRCRIAKISCVYQSGPQARRQFGHDSVDRQLPPPSSYAVGDGKSTTVPPPREAHVRQPSVSVPSLAWWSGGMRENKAGPTVQPSEAGASTSDHSTAATHASNMVEQLHSLGQLLPTSAPQRVDQPNCILASFVLKDGRATLNKTRLFGRSHWDTTVQEVRKTCFPKSFPGRG